MTNNNYSKACTEVLEIISYFPEDEYSKIPKDKIELLEQYKDTGYEYSINPDVELSKQYISKEAKAMIIEIYKEYFATEHQKNVVDDILNHNQMLMEKKKEINYYDKYSKNDFMENQNDSSINDIKNNQSDVSKEYIGTNLIVEYKESFLTKVKNFILRLLHIKE